MSPSKPTEQGERRQVSHLATAVAPGSLGHALGVENVRTQRETLRYNLARLAFLYYQYDLTGFCRPDQGPNRPQIRNRDSGKGIGFLLDSRLTTLDRFP